MRGLRVAKARDKGLNYESSGGGALMQVWRVQAEVGGEKQSLVILDPGCVMMSGACYQVYSHHVGIWVLSLNTALSCPCEVKGMQERATMLTVEWESEGDIAFQLCSWRQVDPLGMRGEGCAVEDL